MNTRPVDTLFPAQKTLKDKGLCPTCGEPTGAFTDALSYKEFLISGMCQECQDSVFGKAPSVILMEPPL